MNLKKNGQGYMRGCRRRKGKGKIILYCDYIIISKISFKYSIPHISPFIISRISAQTCIYFMALLCRLDYLQRTVRRY